MVASVFFTLMLLYMYLYYTQKDDKEYYLSKYREHIELLNKQYKELSNDYNSLLGNK
jgi:hypothetical protein